MFAIPRLNRTPPNQAMLSRILEDVRQNQPQYENIKLRSAFQPVISLAHQRSVGYEALIRGSKQNGEAVPPPDIFRCARNELDTIYLDRFCRALHITNFLQFDDQVNWLFLNVNPNVVIKGIQYGRFFAELLKILGIQPERIVIEILESPLLDESQLCSYTDFYRDLGCLIAIDDFGSGHSNFQRIWRIKPHIVKLDQSILRHASSNRLAKRMLPSIVDTLHEAGSLVLMEGIENEKEALLAMQTNIDLVQGYYFGRPAYALISNEEIKPVVENLFAAYRQDMQNKFGITQYKMHIEAMHLASEQIAMDELGPADLERIKNILDLPGADRFYFLGEDGIQIGQSFIVNQYSQQTINHFRPLDQGSSASWIRRPYLQRAIQRPGEVHLTRPYLSVATGRLCVTLSIAYQQLTSLWVLCYDLDHEWLENFFGAHAQPVFSS